MPLIFYLLFSLSFVKYFIKAKVPNKKKLILIIVLIFLTGISTETQNLFFLTFWGMINLYAIGNCLLNKSTKNVKFLKFISLLDLVYALSLLIYFSHPADHSIAFSNNNDGFFYVFKKGFLNYVIKPYLIFPIVSIFSCILIFITKNRYIKIDKKIIVYSLLNLFSLYFFFFVGNYLLMSVWSSSERYDLFHDKFLFVFLIILIFNVALTLGYLIDTRLKNKKSLLIKSLILLSIFIFVKDIHPKKYFETLNIKRTFLYEQRLMYYQLAKTILNQKSKSNIILPDDIANCKYFDISIQALLVNLFYITGESNNNKVIIYSQTANFSDLSEEEKKKLRFSDIVCPENPSNNVIFQK